MTRARPTTLRELEALRHQAEIARHAAGMAKPELRRAWAHLFGSKPEWAE